MLIDAAMRALRVNTSAVPRGYQHPDDASVVLAHAEADMKLARAFNARALVLADGKAANLDKAELRTAMLSLDSYLRPIHFSLLRHQWGEFTQLMGSINVSPAIANHMWNRVEALRENVAADMGKNPKKLYVALFGRYATPRWHRDEVGPLFVETLLGQGTRWATPLGQMLYEKLLDGKAMQPFTRQVQTGEALLFNHFTPDDTAEYLRYRRLAHAGPDNCGNTIPRLAYAIHFEK